MVSHEAITVEERYAWENPIKHQPHKTAENWYIGSIIISVAIYCKDKKQVQPTKRIIRHERKKY